MDERRRILLWMLLFLAGVTVICVLLFEPLKQAFLANRVFNSMILGVLLVGIVINIRQVMSLGPELKWIRAFREQDTEPQSRKAPRLLSSLAKMLAGTRREGFRLSATTMRSLLDGIRLRLDESRDISRYMSGLLVFLGLLGTFWGLLDTVIGVSDVIGDLSTQGGDISKTFENLKGNLQVPLSGMGTAFSSSLFGLAGALIVGFIDLQAGHAQNRFYNHLEEWLSELTHLPSGTLQAEGEHAALPSYIEALLEQTADNLYNLQRTMTRAEEDRRSGQSHQSELAERLTELTDQMRSEQKLIVSLSKNQMDLQPAINQLANQVTEGWGSDDEIRGHLRNIDVSLGRLTDELAAGRGELLEELRNEIRVLTHTIYQK